MALVMGLGRMKSINKYTFDGLKMPKPGNRRIDCVVLNSNDNTYTIIKGKEDTEYIDGPTLSKSQQLVGFIKLFSFNEREEITSEEVIKLKDKYEEYLFYFQMNNYNNEKPKTFQDINGFDIICDNGLFYKVLHEGN
jgi:uncharacterized protein YcgL (UPF0745 family)